MYEIYALKVGERDTDSPMVLYQTDMGKKTTLSYYFLCLKNKDQVIMLDTGISQAEMAIRGVKDTPSREELLSRISVNPRDVEAIILTHLHSDHFTSPEIYPNCIFYVQRKEFAFWSEDVQRFPAIFSPPFLKGKPGVEIETLQKLNLQKRVRFLDGDTEVYPGISTIWCGAHSPGSQMVNVQTARGNVLCCADFLDIYRNLEELIPVGVLTSVVEWMTSVTKIENLHLSRESIIPGHDPQVFKMFPEVARDVVRIA
jgi:glyoxylase-like metal-dependent hydrolase (beta-lactamase superfamily II)